MGKWTRRALLTTGTLVGGGLLLGVGTVLWAPNRLSVHPDRDPEGGAILTTWLRLHADGRIVVLVPHCEMGQGAQTGLAMLLAEELDADWQQVQISEAPAADPYANGYLLRTFFLAGGEVPAWLERAVDWGTHKLSDWVGLQITGGSASIRGTGMYGMRIAGATARQMLLAAAAQRWQVQAAALHTEPGVVRHADGRQARYADLAQEAARFAPAMHPPLKPRADFRIVGTSPPRADLPDKVSGRAVYGIDVRVPGLTYAAIRMAPVPGSTLAGVDPAPAHTVPGVRAVIELEDAVAVVADSWWRAQQAVLALEPRFVPADPALATVDSSSLRQAHQALLLDVSSGSSLQQTGKGATALPDCAQVFDVEYEVPYLAHATMEPPAATAWFKEGRMTVWAGTQDPLNARHAAAKAADLAVSEVDFHNCTVGGGYGRRLPFCFDWIAQAAQLALRLAPTPVQLIWSREQDLAHDYYRPLVLARVRAGIDAAGQALAFSNHSTGASGQDSALSPYAIPHLEVRASKAPQHLRTGSWRSVDFSWHGFFNESAIDELAALAQADPLQFRLGLLAARPRHRAVLEKVAAMAGWGRALPAGQGLGIAVVESFGTVCAQVAEVAVSGATLRVMRLWAAVDCGWVVHPDQALAQIQGGMLFGLSAALLQEITVKDGAVVQQSFPDFPSLTLAQAPRIDVAFVESDAPIGGLGEPGVPPVAPAVANAVFAACGQRLRRLPLRLA